MTDMEVFYTLVKTKEGEYLPVPIAGLALQGVGLVSALVMTILFSIGVTDTITTLSIFLAGAVCLIVGSALAIGYTVCSSGAGTNEIVKGMFAMVIALGVVLGYGALMEGVLHGAEIATNSLTDVLIAGGLSFALGIVLCSFMKAIPSCLPEQKQFNIKCITFFANVAIVLGLTTGGVASELARYYLAASVPTELLSAATFFIYAGVTMFVITIVSHSQLSVYEEITKVLESRNERNTSESVDETDFR